jgi:hypothetical protein
MLQYSSVCALESRIEATEPQCGEKPRNNAKFDCPSLASEMVEEVAIPMDTSVQNGNGTLVVVPQDQSSMMPVGVSQASLMPKLDVNAIKIATHTKALGIILPPPDIRSIVDKTAQFVVKNGEGCTGLQAADTSSRDRAARYM